MILFKFIGRNVIPGLTTAEIALWEASNPANLSAIIDIDNPAIVYIDDDGLTQRIEFGAASNTWQYQYKNFTGATFTDPALIGVKPVAFYLNTDIRYYAASAPNPADEWTFDPLTGELDIGTPFFEDSFIFEYQAAAEVTPTV
jgi:hypothetical protein